MEFSEGRVAGEGGGEFMLTGKPLVQVTICDNVGSGSNI